MKTLKITYPQIVFETKEIEVSDELSEIAINGCCEEKADFIISQITDLDFNWIPEAKKGLISCIDMGYSTIKIVNRATKMKENEIEQAAKEYAREKRQMKTTDEIMQLCYEGRTWQEMPRQMSRAINLARKDLYPIIFKGQLWLIWETLSHSTYITTGEIAKELNIPSKNISTQLNQMLKTGLIKVDRVGKLKRWARIN